MIDLTTRHVWLLIALALAAVAIVMRRLEGYLPSRRARSFLRRWIVPSLDLMVAGSAAGWVLAELLANRSDVSGLAFTGLFLLLVWVSRSVVADFLTGVVVRMEGVIEPGRRVSAEGVEGRVTRLGLRTIAMEADDGATIQVPWCVMARGAIRLGEEGAAVRSYSFTITVPRDQPIERLLETIPAAALTSPWASTTRAPEVRLQSETETSYVLRITAHALDARFAPQIEAAIRGRLGI